MALRGADGAFSAASTTIPNGSEVVLVTLGPIDVPADSVRVLVFGECYFNTGAGVTTCNMRIRRGPTNSDPIVGFTPQNCVATASAGGSIAVFAIDPLTIAATVIYSLCGICAGGTGTNQGASLFILFV